MLWAKRFFTGYLITTMVLPLSSVHARTLPEQAMARQAGSQVSLPANYAELLANSGLLPDADQLPVAPEALLESAIIAGDGTISIAGNTMVIDQSTARLLLQWASFDIGQDATVHFKQDADATAVNMIEGAAPSQIFGRLIADGQVYLLNENGILFGDGAQINVRGMIAAAARLNGYEDLNALTETEKNEFLENSLLDAIGDGQSLLVVDDEALQDLDLNDPDLPRIVVQRGASVAAESAPVLLAGPQVINDGDITADNSQVVLAATRKDLYLAVSDKDEDLRGYLVEVHSGEGDARGQVINTGAVHAALGNVTLVAADIVQAGKIEATTAVDINGSIRILARDQAEVIDYAGLAAADGAWSANYFDVDANGFADQTQAPSVGKAALGTEAGTARFASGSETRVSIANSDKTATDSLPQPESRIHIEGQEITLADHSVVSARGGSDGSLITLRARNDIDALLNMAETDSTASITVGEGALIDASGTRDTRLAAERNSLEFFITSNEVKDVPDQKGGDLLRETAYVDVRKGTDLFDWEAGLSAVKKSASERSTQGGQVDLLATGAINLHHDATIDVSGGQVAYDAGFVRESMVVSNGELLAISEADPTAPTEIIAVSEDAANSRDAMLSANRYSYAYNEGFDAGNITLTSPTLAVADSVKLAAGVQAGTLQTVQGMPQAGDVHIDLKTLANGSDSEVFISDAGTLPNTITRVGTQIIEHSDAANFRIDALGKITLDAESALELRSGSGIRLDGRDVSVLGDIRAEGGDVAIAATNRALIAGHIDTSGGWTNQQIDANAPVFADAGSVSITGLNAINFYEEASITANAGAWLSREGRQTIGRAGSIHFDMASGIAPGTSSGTGVAEPLVLAGKLQALDAAQGGRLELITGDVEIGGDTDMPVTTMLLSDGSTRTQLGNTFFNTLEVGGVSIEAREGNLRVVDAAALRPSQMALAFRGDAGSVVSSIETANVLGTRTLNSAERNGGYLSLSATSFDSALNNGSVFVDAGARLDFAPEADVRIEANRRIVFGGTLASAGGQVQLRLSGISGDNQAPTVDQAIVLTDDARIDLSAALRAAPGGEVASSAQVVAAGEVNVTAETGYVLVDDGAQIALAGGSYRVEDVVTGALQARTVAADAGALNVTADAGAVLAGNVEFGDGANRDYRGGHISLTLDSNERARDASQTPETLRLLLGGDSSLDSETYAALAGLDRLAGQSIDTLDSAERAALATVWQGKGVIAESHLTNDALATLRLNVVNTRHPDGVTAPTANFIEVVADTSVQAKETIVLDSTALDLAGNTLQLAAPYVQLGKTSGALLNQVAPAASGAGEGVLDVQADLIDVAGRLALNGDGEIRLQADSGVQLRSVINSSFTNTGETPLVMPGSLTAHGDIAIAAPDLWVTTMSDYSIATEGSFAYRQHGQADAEVLSAGGALAISAAHALIDSRISVPYGTLEVAVSDVLGDSVHAGTGLRDGELVLGSAAALVVASEAAVPLGRTKSEDFSWVYSPSGAGTAQINFDTPALAPLDKRITLEGASVLAQEGAILDVAGGGDVYAKEFVAGLEGTVDFLKQANHEDYFAIVPGYHSGFTPYDPVEFNGSAIPWGKQLQISGSAQLPDGVYTVMPANYALTPGAFLVTPEAGVAVNEGFRTTAVNGAELVSGRFSFAGGANTANWTRFMLAAGAELVSQRANYATLSADDYFTGDAYQPATRPGENGGLSIKAGDELDFAAQLLRNSAASSGTFLDIAAAGDILIADDISALPSSSAGLRLATSLFAAIDADSLLLGGTRVWDNGAWRVAEENIAGNVRFSDGELRVNEVLTVAANTISLNDTSLRSEGEATFAGNVWNADAAEAVLMVSNADGSRLSLADRDSSAGNIDIADDSQVAANAAMALVFNGRTERDGALLGVREGVVEPAERLQLFAESLQIADAAEAGNVDAGVLAATRQLELASPDGLEINADTNLGLDNLTLRTSAIRLAENVQATFAATDSVRIESQSVASDAAGAEANTELRIAAETLALASDLSTLEAAAQLRLNAENVAITATSALVAEGDLALELAGDATIQTPQMLLGEDGARFALATEGALQFISVDDVTSVTTLTAPAASGIGGIVSLQADDLLFDTRVNNLSGSVRLRSMGDLTLGAAANLNLAAYAQTFNGEQVTGPAGLVSLQAGHDLTIHRLSSFDYGDSGQAEDGVVELVAGNTLDILATGTLGTSSHGLDLRVQAAQFATADSGNMAELEALAAWNAAGADGDIAVTVSSADAELVLSQNWLADGFAFISAAGRATVTGELQTRGDHGAIQLYGQRGVQVDESARIISEGEHSEALRLHSAEGAVSVAESAVLSLSGGLDVTVAAGISPTADQRIHIDADDRLGMDANAPLLDLYLSSAISDNNVTKAEFATYVESSVAAAARDASDFVVLAGDLAADQIKVRPALDIYSDANLTLGGFNETIDLMQLRSHAGDAGRFTALAAGDMTINKGVSDGVRLLRPGIDFATSDFIFDYLDDLDAAPAPFAFVEDVLALSGADSADIALVSGRIGNSLAHASDALAEGSLVMAANSSVRTGTGNIDLFVAGDLEQGDGAYIATVGKATGLDAEGLPTWAGEDFYGGISTPSLWLLDGTFGGFSHAAGSVSGQIGGQIIGASANQNAADFIHRFAADNNVLVSGLDYANMRSAFAAINRISGGVHAIGGGSVALQAQGAITNLSITTPGVFEGLPQADDAEIAPLRYEGGQLLLQSGTAMRGINVHNDGGDLRVLSRGDIATNAADQALLLVGSGTVADVRAIGDVAIDGTVNTSMLPLNPEQYSFFADGGAGFDRYYFDAYDSSALALQSISGNVRSRADVDGALAAYYDSELAASYAKTKYAHMILPGRFEATALRGDLLFDSRGNALDNTVSVFPGAKSSFALRAAGDIRGFDLAANETPLTFYISDFTADSLPTMFASASGDQLAQGKTVAGSLRARGKIVPFSFENDPSRNHGARLVDRSAALPNEVISLYGSIGSLAGGIAFNTPAPIQAFAGGDIVNASFHIQHNQAGDLSVIQAVGDFVYPLKRDEQGILRESADQIVRVAGQGDMLLIAGGDIDFGTSKGVRSIANQDNPLLTSDGSNIHLFAGAKHFGDWSTLTGTAVTQNTDLPLVASIAGDDEAAQRMSFIGLVDEMVLAIGSETPSINAGNARLAEWQLLADLVAQATGRDYRMGNGAINTDFVQDYAGLDNALRQRIAVDYLSQQALRSPETIASGADGLFAVAEIAGTSLPLGEERSALLQTYMARSGNLLLMSYMLTPQRQADFLASSGLTSLDALYALPMSDQLALAEQSFDEMSWPKQLLAAEYVMLQHNAQGGAEGRDAGNAIAQFERGYLAQRMFFGSDNDFALKWMHNKSRLSQIKADAGNLQNLLDDIAAVNGDSAAEATLAETFTTAYGLQVQANDLHQLSAVIGSLRDIDGFTLGGFGETQVSTVDGLLQAWERDSGVTFDYAPAVARQGDIDMRFSTIQSRLGGDINLFAAAGSIDVGSSAALVNSLFGKTIPNDQLGVLAFGRGDINSVVADAFNVNESRTIPLAGGDINLWSGFGDIDAGRGAKTAESTPPTEFSVSRNTGAIALVQPPSVAGSGITTSESRSASSAALSDRERYDRLQQGSGAIKLATPFGIVDAGEAGIQSAGDLFIAAAEVRGTDNISFGGISTGVPTTAAVGGELGGVDSAIDAATDSVQAAAEKAATESAARSTAFVTIELL